MQTPCCLEPHDGFAVCPECGYRDVAVAKPPFIITVASVSGKTGMFAPLGRGGDVIEC
jgi:hypothetical protein